MLELVNDTAAAHAYGTYFGDGATVRIKPGGLQIKRHIIGGESGGVFGNRGAGGPVGMGLLAKNGNAGNGHWMLLLSVDVR